MKCTPASHFAAFSFIAMSIGLAACEQRSPWRFEGRDGDFDAVTLVTKVEYPNQATLEQAAGKLKRPDGKRIDIMNEDITAFGRLDKDRRFLEIHFVKPEANTDFECDIGHELAHGFYGEWHGGPAR